MTSVHAPNGAVATSEPTAARAGLEILKAGGSAVDAALAMAATLTVTEPCSNGIGADAFALVWDGGKLYGLNGSGRAPADLTLERLTAQGHQTVPLAGWESVTVPGAVAAWSDLHERFGRLPFARVLEPAILAAEDGFVLAPVVAEGWTRGFTRAQNFAASASGDLVVPFFQTFGHQGGERPPRAGERVRLPDHAATLTRIAETSGRAFYEGELAEQIVAHSECTEGYLTAADLAAHASTWVDPISTNYRGFDVWQIPPNGQGIAALIALNILEGFAPEEIARGPELDERATHLQIEAIKLALTDAHAFVADPDHADVPISELLSKDYAATRRALISDTALTPAPGTPQRGGTVLIVAADSRGQMVSLIQSNFHGFGSYITIPGTGIALQNRASGFSLDPAHPNVLAPSKRPFHTIIPGFLTRGGTPVGPFGVMGGHMQPQGHVQILIDTIDRHLDPQSALDLPRWHWDTGRSVHIEAAADHLIDPLRARGHEVSVGPVTLFGRGQIIWRDDGGAYVAGSDSRADGLALGY